MTGYERVPLVVGEFGFSQWDFFTEWPGKMDQDGPWKIQPALNEGIPR